MTPEEKLLALIQQDKRQAGTITPQEKLLELIEQDKRKKEPSIPSQPVVVVAPPSQVVKKPAPPVQPVSAQVKPIPAEILIPVSVKPTTAPVTVPVPENPKPSVVAPPALMTSSPSEVSPPVPAKPVSVIEAKKTGNPLGAKSTQTNAEPVKAPLIVMTPPAAVKKVEPASTPAAVIAQKPSSLESEPASSVPQPLLFPTIRVSGVTITNRVLAVMVALLIVIVFVSVAGTQRGINDEIKRQLNGAGEMSVAPLTVSDEPIPALELLLEKVSTRNFFAPKLSEKGKDGGDAPVAVGVTKDFKLVAVSLDATTASESMAIIKCKTDSKTYFVKIGESVGDTGFVLSKVLADRIVLKQRKQEFELK